MSLTSAAVRLFEERLGEIRRGRAIKPLDVPTIALQRAKTHWLLISS